MSPLVIYMFKFEPMCLRKINISVNAWLCPEYYKSIPGGTSMTFTVDTGTLILEVKEITFMDVN